MVVAWRSAAGFSRVASNILVAGAGGTPLAERSLSGTVLDASIYSASMSKSSDLILRLATTSKTRIRRSLNLPTD